MSRLTPPESRLEMADSDTDNTSEFEALCRLIRRGQEEFFFVLVRYDLPQRRRELLDKLAAALPEVNLVTVTLAPPAPDVSSTYNVLDQLRDRAHAASPDRAPDVLVILGYETLLLEDPERPDSPPAPELGRAIQPLNLAFLPFPFLAEIIASRFGSGLTESCPVSH